MFSTKKQILDLEEIDTKPKLVNQECTLCILLWKCGKWAQKWTHYINQRMSQLFRKLSEQPWKIKGSLFKSTTFKHGEVPHLIPAKRTGDWQFWWVQAPLCFLFFKLSVEVIPGDCPSLARNGREPWGRLTVASDIQEKYYFKYFFLF